MMPKPRLPSSLSIQPIVIKKRVFWAVVDCLLKWGSGVQIVLELSFIFQAFLAQSAALEDQLTRFSG
jgi:hypothetical protein